MKTTQLHGIDLKALANEAPGSRLGEWTLADFPRLLQELHPDHATQGQVSAQLKVWWEHPVGVPQPQLWSCWQAQVDLPLTCQRCLGLCPQTVHVKQTYRWVDTEEQAAQEDESAQEDVLALDGDIDLMHLLEDELIMSLPAFVKHDSCQVPVAIATDRESVRPHPFAQLAQWKKSGS